MKKIVIFLFLLWPAVVMANDFVFIYSPNPSILTKEVWQVDWLDQNNCYASSIFYTLTSLQPKEEQAYLPVYTTYPDFSQTTCCCVYTHIQLEQTNKPEQQPENKK